MVKMVDPSITQQIAKTIELLKKDDVKQAQRILSDLIQKMEKKPHKKDQANLSTLLQEESYVL